MKEKLQKYIDNNLEIDVFINFNKYKKNRENASCSIFFEDVEDADLKIDRTYLDEEFDKEDDSEIKRAKVFGTLASANISDYINDNKEDNKFQKLLFEYIDNRNLKDSDVYNKVHIDRRLFSKIRSDQDYHPSKETIILLGLSLELSEEEIETLLDSASYSLPKNNIYDLIIRFCFVEGIYDLKDVNELLDSQNCKMFSY